MTMTLHHPEELVDVPDDIPVLEMVRPMMGFPDQRRFALTRLDDAGTLCHLASLDDPDLRFVVVPPSVFFEDYAPSIDEESAAALSATSGDDLLTLVVLTLGASAAEATANLMAPVLINHRTREAAQVLVDESYPLRAPLGPTP